MKRNKIMLMIAISAIMFPLAQASNINVHAADDVVELNVYNCADYICEDDDEAGTEGVIKQFEKYCKETYNTEVKVNYSTYETNEDMYNQLRAGGVRYDVICPSDYMLEKLIMNDMVEPLSSPVANYVEYGSPYIKSKFDTVKTHTKDGTEVTFKDYSVPYMWGTMGFMYNPTPDDLQDGDDIRELVSSWDVIWNESFKNKVSLKDSIRDTYIVGAIHVYKEELKLVKQLCDNGLITADEYNKRLTSIMNRCDDETISYIETSLKKAKENVYEFEVDTGKEHIVKGDYWINLCWSGDAVYALDLAEEEDVLLEYVVPSEGSNVWFDGLAMPKGANKLWAERFLNFMCDPAIASQNMDYVGYTSAISGQDMWELALENYEAEEGEETTDYDLTYFFKDSGIVDENGDEITSFIIHTSEKNRQLYAQYPDEDTIKRCGVMTDFGSQNEKVSEMWIRVKGNASSWYIYLVLGVVVALIIFAEIKSITNKRARKHRAKAK